MNHILLRTWRRYFCWKCKHRQMESDVCQVCGNKNLDWIAAPIIHDDDWFISFYDLSVGERLPFMATAVIPIFVRKVQ